MADERRTWLKWRTERERERKRKGFTIDRGGNNRQTRERTRERGVKIFCCSCFFITMETTDHSEELWMIPERWGGGQS